MLTIARGLRTALSAIGYWLSAIATVDLFLITALAVSVLAWLALVLR